MAAPVILHAYQDAATLRIQGSDLHGGGMILLRWTGSANGGVSDPFLWVADDLVVVAWPFNNIYGNVSLTVSNPNGTSAPAVVLLPKTPAVPDPTGPGNILPLGSYPDEMRELMMEQYRGDL